MDRGLLSLKSVFDLKEYEHPNSFAYSDNFSHSIKKLQRNKGFKVNHSQILGLMTLIIILAYVRSL